MNAIAPCLIVDNGLDAAYLGDLAVSLRDARASNIGFLTVPAKQESGKGTAVPDGAKVSALAADLHADRLDRYQP
ncbi:hypothetical protein QDR37_03425 [Amnibacterium sp. CER49]|uniref:hypothetical protein n=1 Tax=Amnibacterium sp. CER49 TaxID=3039161 RepID=UPI00244B6759|nr:hypothetical protein [Amnibacterium sp. CER49]MDH2442990.1 hypothetical protein [Amnibacterium sp. CER49]